MNRTIQTIIFVTGFIFAGIVFAANPVYTSFFSNKAISGYDTVAYFTQNRPVKGKTKYSTEYKGARWLFSSAKNLARFKANPKKYAPQYGGYCAWAASQNYLYEASPKHWSIHNGKLYLNYNKSVKNSWLKNKSKHIVKADKNWPVLLKK